MSAQNQVVSSNVHSTDSAPSANVSSSVQMTDPQNSGSSAGTSAVPNAGTSTSTNPSSSGDVRGSQPTEYNRVRVYDPFTEFDEFFGRRGFQNNRLVPSLFIPSLPMISTRSMFPNMWRLLDTWGSDFDLQSDFNRFSDLVERHSDDKGRSVSISSDLANSFDTDFVEKDGSFVLETSFPKEMIDHLKIREKKGHLLLSADQIVEKDDSKDGYVSKSRTSSSIRRTLRLPKHSVPNTATAKYDNGKLTISVTKDPATKTITHRDVQIDVTKN
ncbi:heat-shock protein [Yasminevirus sp. GU-2018]|uniref:Heat-shock protein n=1 Tax=Yasminevirus sp. GU-2018 TaxID=2420051 RepID=A0A5K0U8J8_9VIRU|nr:heat-shock protein [Yasminevirus sp. GU-2018]